MTLTKLIKNLNEAFKENGDMEVEGIADGIIYPYIDINCPDAESPLYIELARD